MEQQIEKIKHKLQAYKAVDQEVIRSIGAHLLDDILKVESAIELFKIDVRQAWEEKYYALISRLGDTQTTQGMEIGGQEYIVSVQKKIKDQ